ncbi:aminotransferase class IV [Cellulomonas marina]|uniref:Branched-chain amino acid aminotransferase n=1 Tax=Cellulomonas marina TaxID=988821 RepID=A0A1I0W528_9CELL|nr:aminotransferase class IV [Cellulomonas marina]GIG30525.1 4-amino-4-deoxychorismate lyase [Cellulomonas marina]SFA83869.1 branched-chain amino acid aminotransferase [Cellulomonas marina]
MSVVVWSAGRLVDPAAPLLTPVDHGVTVGDGVFETCAVRHGQVFALTRHLRRLALSAAGLGLPVPDEAEVRAGAAAVLAAAPDAGRLRITVTAGPSPLGPARAPDDEIAPTLLVAAAPAGHGGATTARAVTVPWVRNERSSIAGLKTTSYAEQVAILRHARAEGADEALVANTVGDLCEGAASNVFVARGGEVLTPPLSSGCLAGVTRDLVLEWSADAGLPVRAAAPGELRYDAVVHEVLTGTAALALSGSVRGLTPVVELDGTPVEPGDAFEAVRALYVRRSAEDLDP